MLALLIEASGVGGQFYASSSRATAFLLGGSVHLGPLSLVFTLLWIVGVINAMNLIDGLDGLAAGVGLVGVATTFVVAASRGDAIMMLFMAGLGGSLLGFLAYNFRVARGEETAAV